jgi:hypothetical protein
LKYPDTQFLRALAIIIIINSHLDRYYPIPYIGTGGAIGNSIFFFLSSFGIFLSQQKQNKPFSEWYAGRIGRIYPSLWIVLSSMTLPIMIMNGEISSDMVITVIGFFLNPPYWFLQMLLVYYLLAFPLLKEDSKNNALVIFTILIIIYFGIYITWVDHSKWSIEKLPFVLIHYFMIFIFGIYVARKNKNIAYSGPGNYFFLIFFIALIYTHKFLMTKGLYLEYQFLQQAAMYPVVYYQLKISRSPFIASKLLGTNTFSRTVQFLSNNTLEIYMVHETISSPILKLQMPFPVNLIVFLVVTFCLSAIVNRLANKMRECIA